MPARETATKMAGVTASVCPVPVRYLKYSGKLEARVGIEPTYTDLQSAASPLCHRATVPVHGASSPVRKVT